MYDSPEDERVVREIGRQCDDADWTLGRRDDESACYWSASLPGSPVIGFKRVSFVEGADLDEMARAHAEGIVDIWAWLSKPTYARGEVLQVLNASEDVYHAVVRTLFDLPLGMAGREYLHHVYRKRIDPETWVIAYRTPDDASPYPTVTDGYVRATIFDSGDRLHRLPDGRIRVEHLMTYTLNGHISPRMTDLLFRRAHIDVYYEEGRSVREVFDGTAGDRPDSYPAQFSMYVSRSRYRPELLAPGMARALDDERPRWRLLLDDGDVRISAGRVPYSPLTALRAEFIWGGPAERLARILSEGLIDHLPHWDDSFVAGELRTGDATDRWWVRSVHRAPWPLRPREYVYLVVRQDGPDATLIASQSVLELDMPVPSTQVRGVLHPSAWRLSSEPDGRTRVERLVIRELDGAVSRARQERRRNVSRAGRALARRLRDLRALAEPDGGR